MAWFYLVLAGIFEIGFTTALRYLTSWTQVVPLTAFIVCSIVSFQLLVMAMREIPLGTAYAVWTGIGALGTVIMGIVIYGEPATGLRLLFLMMLIGSIIGLKVVS